MARFKEKLYRFMYGRYGTDQLYSFLTVLFFIVWAFEIIAVMIIPEGTLQNIVSIIGGSLTMLLLIVMIFRSMSRNIYKRRRENEIYLKTSRAVKRFFGGNTSRKTKSLNRDDAQYIFRDCTKCGSVLRLPRRVGRHKTKCPRCSHSFYVKAKNFKYKAPKY
jgi:phage FluMu protein Com